MESIVLIGYQGVGKSTFGKRLADLLGFEFIDTDIEMEQRDKFGRTNRQIFLGDGEEGFREQESQVLMSLVGVKSTIISCGGGSVEIPNAVDFFSSFKHVLYLYSDLKSLKPRWKNPRIFLKDLSLEEAFERRDKLYRRFCTETVEGKWDQILLAKCLQSQLLENLMEKG